MFFYDCTPIVITVDHVLKRLNQVNVNKSEGPDLIHPRVIYEIRLEIAQPIAMLLTDRWKLIKYIQYGNVQIYHLFIKRVERMR